MSHDVHRARTLENGPAHAPVTGSRNKSGLIEITAQRDKTVRVRSYGYREDHAKAQ
jgi:hypothetical protein